MVCFTLLSLSLVGIPPFGGFFSKWYLISAALADVPGALGFVIAGVLLFSALLTAGYLFPPVVRSFFPGRAFPGAARVAEPLTMVLPLAVMAAVCLLLGLFPNGSSRCCARSRDPFCKEVRMNGLLLTLPVALPFTAGLLSYFIRFPSKRAQDLWYGGIICLTTALAWLAILLGR